MQGATLAADGAYKTTLKLFWQIRVGIDRNDDADIVKDPMRLRSLLAKRVKDRESFPELSR
jgi:hypothetical protein